VESTPYGDLLGGLERFQPQAYAGVAVVCEWYDLEPRLGFRRLGGWAPSLFDDIVASVQASFSRLRNAIERIAASVPVAISLPTLPLPPIEICVSAQCDRMEAQLWRAAWEFGAWCASVPCVRLLSAAELDYRSSPSERFDFRTDLGRGAPYRIAHASALAELMSRLLAPDPPLKGLITDLDDTLWDGILGEVGAEGICFTLETGDQIHGLYQQFLQSLAERGVLVAIASKNDGSQVERALRRNDLLVHWTSFFPVETHWRPKSESVAKILHAWNVGPESVAFVDDSPLEAAEVQAHFRQIRTLIFPKGDSDRFPEFLRTLQDWFGKPTVHAEDRLRAESLRSSAEVQTAANDRESQDAFLATIDARLSFQISRNGGDERALELVNKTNQFNLNGRRISEARWREILGRSENFLLTVTYQDKFGPLGKVAVVLGCRLGREARVCTWVMSCRAFSRRVEHATLRYLFQRFEVESISFEFEATERNTPLRQFLAEMGMESASVSRADFDARCPRLSHSLEEFTLHA
jgi:FkbH-like protein